jgi:DNA-directed RNA polymerase specialized sigma24 family protein
VGIAEEDGFADLLNGFTLDSRRRRRMAAAAPQVSAVEESVVPQSFDDVHEENASIVRAYAWTGGRTRSDFGLEIETLVSTTVRALDVAATLSADHQEVVELCRHSRSVAEVGAMLGLPLGVARVLLGDMARLGLITVHQNESGPDLELLERVLHGLTNLRS